MASKKKSKKKELKLENDIYMYILALGLIVLALIALLKQGFIGESCSNIGRFLVGSYYGVLFGLMLATGVWIPFRNSIPNLRSRTVMAVVVLFFAFLLWSAIPLDESLVGWDVISYYITHASEIFHNTLPAQGGILGAFMYSILSLLVGRIGTIIIIVAMFILCLLLLIKKETYLRWIGELKTLFKKTSAPKVKKVEKKRTEPILDETQFKENGKRFVTIDLEEKPKKSKSIFIDTDVDEEDFDSAEINIEPIQSDKKADLPKESKKKNIEFSKQEIVIEQESVSKENVESVRPPLKEEILDEENNGTQVETKEMKEYVLPPHTYLNKPSSTAKGKSKTNANAAAVKGQKLIEILGNFGIPATLVATHIGPAVTKFEIRPDSTVKVNKILSIQDNIKMELVARDIRIEAPIPGRNAVGIEIPNVETTPVAMAECIDEIPANKMDNKLLIVLGKDLLGRAVFCELNKMPHLLIAGATGSGKSVCMNTIISSILLRTKPDEVKLLLVDPKKVEFAQYAKIPHLIGPVINDAAEASRALKVVVEMMDQRYDLFSKCAVRNIATYNEKLAAHPEEHLKPMPYVVVIIDELADLMISAGKEVEQSIQRITQLARAAGIHLIVATQRPSVDVITGVIKSNIPSRIAFAVSSGTDSRTILDTVGAERLLGYGDMLYMPIGEPSAIRLQGVYMSDEEVSSIADYCAAQRVPMYEDAFIRLEEVDGTESSGFVSSHEDPLYDEVKEYVIEVQKASTSLLQRRFGIGYNRAAKLIDVLEERGIIGPTNGSKPRDVYIKKGAADYDEDEE